MAIEISLTAPQTQDLLLLPDLPQEIVTEILLRLPVKSILKFRCVSKSWLLLFSSSHFVKAHLEISTKNNVYSHDRLVFGSKGSPPPMDLYTCSLQSAVDVFISPSFIYPLIDQDLLVQRAWFDYPSYEPDDVIWLLGSCNGLVCVSLSVETLILWNPATRKSKILPKSDTDLDFDYYGITFGFGYDDLNDDYKVIEFFSFERVTGTLEIQIKVYSLRANSWKTLLNWPGGDTFGGSGKFLNGAIHWSVSEFDGPVEWKIVSHDLATDNFSVLQLPNFEDDDVRVEGSWKMLLDWPSEDTFGGFCKFHTGAIHWLCATLIYQNWLLFPWTKVLETVASVQDTTHSMMLRFIPSVMALKLC